MSLQRSWPFILHPNGRPKDPKISLAAPQLLHQIILFGHVPRSHSRASNRRRRNTDATDALVTPCTAHVWGRQAGPSCQLFCCAKIVH